MFANPHNDSILIIMSVFDYRVTVFYEFQAKNNPLFHVHTSVVIRTFPESRLVIIGVHRAVGTHAPMPFSVLVVYQMLLDEVPTSESLLHGHFVIKVLVEVGMSHYVLGLHPPVAVSIGLSFIQKSLVYHAAVGRQSFIGSGSDVFYKWFHFLQEILIAQNKGSLCLLYTSPSPRD